MCNLILSSLAKTYAQELPKKDNLRKVGCHLATTIVIIIMMMML